MSSDGAVLALETRSKAVANVAGNGALPSETTLADGSQLRFIFKVVKSLSLVMLLPQDDQEGMDLSTLLALHCPEMAADTTGQEVLHQRGERVMLQTVAVSGDSLEALQGVRCSVHVVNSCLVFLPQVRACRAVCGACVPLSPLFLIAVPRCSLLRVLQGVLRVCHSHGCAGVVTGLRDVEGGMQRRDSKGATVRRGAGVRCLMTCSVCNRTLSYQSTLPIFSSSAFLSRLGHKEASKLRCVRPRPDAAYG